MIPAALRYRYVDVMKALTKISLTSETKDERSVAAGLKKINGEIQFHFSGRSPDQDIGERERCLQITPRP